jgi:hypothetical protein
MPDLYVIVLTCPAVSYAYTIEALLGKLTVVGRFALLMNTHKAQGLDCRRLSRQLPRDDRRRQRVHKQRQTQIGREMQQLAPVRVA